MLAEIPLFDGLAPEELAAIAEHAVKRAYRKNTVIMELGDEANTLYLLLEGRVKTYVADDKGKEIVLNELGPGAQLGELALVGDIPRTASVMTIEDSLFLVLTKRSFLQCLAEQPSIALNLVRLLAHRIKILTESVSDLALGDVYLRLGKFLNEVAVEENGLRMTPPYTHQELAYRVGACREMVSKILGDLRDGGYLTTEGRRLVLLKRLPAKY